MVKLIKFLISNVFKDSWKQLCTANDLNVIITDSYVIDRLKINSTQLALNYEWFDKEMKELKIKYVKMQSRNGNKKKAKQ